MSVQKKKGGHQGLRNKKKSRRETAVNFWICGDHDSVQTTRWSQQNKSSGLTFFWVSGIPRQTPTQNVPGLIFLPLHLPTFSISTPILTEENTSPLSHVLVRLSIKALSLALAKGDRDPSWACGIMSPEMNRWEQFICSFVPAAWVPEAASACPFSDLVVQVSWDLVLPCLTLPINPFFFSKTGPWFFFCHRPLEAEVKNDSPKEKQHQTSFLEFL